jgi:hypothetical protein
MHVYAVSAAIDLGSAQLDQIEQGLLQATFTKIMFQPKHRFVGARRNFDCIQTRFHKSPPAIRATKIFTLSVWEIEEKAGMQRAHIPVKTQGRRLSMSFGMYMIGYIVLIVGLAIGAHLLHVPPRWIGVGIICMMGLGILTGVTTTRHRDPPG